MEAYRTEEEQVEALKRWWRENGKSTVLAVVLAICAGVGWQTWQRNAAVSAQNASALYQQMLEELSDQQAMASGEAVAAAAVLARRIKSEYASSTYAEFAALHLARIAVESGDLTAAESELRWVLENAKSGSDLYLVAQLRLGRVLAARDETEQAMAVLAKGEGTPYAGVYAMTRGDILLALGREDEAAAAYAQARDSFDAQRPVPTLEQKIQHLNPRSPTTASVALEQ